MELNDLLKEVASGLKTASRKPSILNYKPNPGGQDGFHKSDSVGRLLAGSNRSGKTVAGIVEDCWWLTQTHPYIKTPDPPVYGRIITVDFKHGCNEIIIPQLQQWLPKSYLKKGSWAASYSKADHKLTLINGSTLEIMTHEQDLEAFAGVPRHFLHVDEECPQSIFVESRLRLLDYSGKFWITMTPVEGMTWIYDNLVEKDSNNTKVFEIDLEDNRFISSEARALLGADLDDEQKQIRIHGKFIPKGGKVFTRFDPNYHVIKEGIPPKNWMVYVSIDSGINNPTAVLWHSISPEGMVVTFMEHYASDMTIRQHVQRIKQINKYYGIEPVMYIGDPSMSQRNLVTGTSILVEYQRLGISIMPGKNDVLVGIDKMNDYFRRGMWYITANCPNAIREHKNYSWKVYDSEKNADKNNKRQEPQKKNDHTCDSNRYFFSFMPHLGPSTKVPQKPSLSRTVTEPEDFPWHVDSSKAVKTPDLGWGEV